MHALPAAAAAALLLVAATAWSQVPPAPVAQVPSPEPRVLESAVVTGVLPGPGLWKVRHGENTMWILGTQSPLPARMQWEAAKVRSAISKSSAVLAPPSVSVGSDIGFFGKLALIPAVMKVRNNPGGVPLREVVGATAYARWVPLRQRYFGNDRGIEKRRPLVAASELYERAMDRSGLTSAKHVYDEVEKAMKKRGLKWTRSTAEFKVENIRGAVKELQRVKLDDGDCFERTLDRLETDVGYMRLRANAWATGDVDALHRLQRPDQYEACRDALLKSALAGKYGVEGAEAQAEQTWLANADAALRANRGTFAVLPMRHLLTGDGLLAKLAARGYVVEAPSGPVAATR